VLGPTGHAFFSTKSEEEVASLFLDLSKNSGVDLESGSFIPFCVDDLSLKRPEQKIIY